MTHIQNDFTRFITDHESDDTALLLLNRHKWKDVDIDLCVNTIETRRKLKYKVPSWYAEPALEYPFKLSGEQCSSEITAKFKADLAYNLINEATTKQHTDCTPKQGCNPIFNIADLTGGMGIDSWAFSKIATKVLYNEMNSDLAEATKRNFKTLQRENIIVSSTMIVPGSATELLSEFKPDLIYLDPARRAGDGKKVFLIEDCSPDVLQLKDELLSISRFVMIKLSPMADIDMVLERLGSQCRDLHIVEYTRECKELLIIMDREWSGECSIHAGNFTFLRSEEKNASGRFATTHDEIMKSQIMFEPGKALLKSGAFNLISDRLNLTKLAKSSHLYVSYSDDIQEDALSGYGKVFRIKEISPLNKASIKETGKKYPQAEVTARNLPITSDLLRKKLGVSSGGDTHIFATSCEYSGKRSQLLFICQI